MTKALQAKPLTYTWDDQLDLIKNTVCKGATDDEMQLYFFDCTRHGVHPLDRLLHFTKRGGKYTPITSIDFMRSRAADTQQYAGMDDPEVGPVSNGYPEWVKFTVYRMVGGTRCPFIGKANWEEYYPGQELGFMWRKLPETMLEKCAESKALRRAFPKELAGLYSKEEMEQADKPKGNDTAGLEAKLEAGVKALKESKPVSTAHEKSALAPTELFPT